MPPTPPTLDDIRRTVGALGDDPPTLLEYLKQIAREFPEHYSELLSDVTIEVLPRSELRALLLKAAEEWDADLRRAGTG